MTKQSYREYMEALENENDSLKRQVARLEAELKEARVWDKRSLDVIIADEQLKSNTKNIVSMPYINVDNKSIGCRAFMEQYREYRKLKSEETSVREIELDISAIDKLKMMMKQKPTS